MRDVITAADLRSAPTAEVSADAHEVWSLTFRMDVEAATRRLQRMDPAAVRDVLLAADILRWTALHVLGGPMAAAVLTPDCPSLPEGVEGTRVGGR